MFEYEIGDRKFIQKPMVWGQVKQFQSLMKDIVWPDEFNVFTFMDLFSDQMPEFVAIVLQEVDVDLKNKNIESLKNEFEEFLDIATSIKVVEDFLDCNPIDSILKSLVGMIRKIKGSMNLKLETPLNTSSASSPEEILASENG